MFEESSEKEAYLEPKQASTMELYVDILNHLLFLQ